jgi:hypothetical protein
VDDIVNVVAITAVQAGRTQRKTEVKQINKAKLVLNLLVKGYDLIISCFYSANLCALCGKLLFIG